MVNDDRAFRKSISSFLEDEGFFVKAVSSGDEAVAVVRQNLIPFSLALLDYHMPELKAPDTIKKLKE